MTTETGLWIALGVAVAAALAGALRFDLLGVWWREVIARAPSRAGAVVAPPVQDEPPQPHAASAHPAPPRKPAFHRSGRRG